MKHVEIALSYVTIRPNEPLEVGDTFYATNNYGHYDLWEILGIEDNYYITAKAINAKDCIISPFFQ